MVDAYKIGENSEICLSLNVLRFASFPLKPVTISRSRVASWEKPWVTARKEIKEFEKIVVG